MVPLGFIVSRETYRDNVVLVEVLLKSDLWDSSSLALKNQGQMIIKEGSIKLQRALAF